MSGAEKLKAALVRHDYDAWYMLDAISALLEATDFDATPAQRHKARYAAKRDLQAACKALEQAQVIRVVAE